jgi:hypothetical protein
VDENKDNGQVKDPFHTSRPGNGQDGVMDQGAAGRFIDRTPLPSILMLLNQVIPLPSFAKNVALLYFQTHSTVITVEKNVNNLLLLFSSFN